MAVIPVLIPDFDGTQLVWNACASGGDQVPFDRKRSILIRNDDASAKTVTIAIETATLGVASPEQVVSVPAGQYFMFAMSQENVNPATGNVHVTYSAVTSLSIAVIQTPS